MLQKIPLENILFLDIETVPEQADYEDLTQEARELWEHKTRYQRKEEFTPAEFYERAGIWAEFGKVVCISAGFFQESGGPRTFRVKSFTGSEPELLREFSSLLEGYFRGPRKLLCAHNGKEFDFPYLARRMIIHGLPLPAKLNLFGKKPWEVPHLDTMELWKFGDFKHYTSLRLLAHILGIPSPKQDLDGSQIRSVYYEEQDVERIRKYCELDVITTAQVFLRLRGEDLLPEGNITRIDD
ncbi:3'-5' exonuclease [Robiginitalea sp. M366]|uniref:3'-5' exonuclease n=1 Tax=Robiginitalea aestuariiviva TaxID=3036903 RepID=UPI00240D3CA4|nr:3'-5' exonuclease [Robiginitalea aestuariiviva]MDG1571371.1 3'-5' exonuclease [Robiginitalea aestuariiviva]